MKYRDHRGGLKESMETQIEVNNKQDIINHLNDFFNEFGETVEEIKFEYVGLDKRTGWNTYYVLKRYKNKKEFSVAGMSNDQF